MSSELSVEELEALLALLEDFVDDEPHSPEVLAWEPVIHKLRNQLQVRKIEERRKATP